MSGPNTVIQYSFSTGIVSPGVKNRRDWQKIDGAAADILNGTVGPTGGVRKRPGLRFINEALHDDMPIRLVEFEFSQNQTYQLEFGDYVMRFYSDRGLVLDADDNVYQIETPYSAQQAQEFTFAQERDAMFFAHWDKPLKRLTRYGHANWVWDDVFRESDRIDSPDSVSFYTEATNGHTGHEYAVTSYRILNGAPEESIGFSTVPSRADDTDFIPEQPNQNIASCIFWINKYRAAYGHLAGFPTYPAVMDLSGVYNDFQAGAIPQLETIFRAQYPTLGYIVDDTFKPSPSGYPNDIKYRWNLYEPWQIGVPAEQRLIARYDYWYEGGSSGNTGPLVPQASGPRYTWLLRDMAISIINSNYNVAGYTMSGIYNAIMAFLNSYNQTHGAKDFNRIKWPAISNAEGYYVYRRDIGGADKTFKRIAVVTASTDFNDQKDADGNLTPPDSNPAKSPIAGLNEFDGADNYPNLVTFFQQRLVLGCTKSKPTTIFGGRTGSTGGTDPDTGEYIQPDFSIDPTDNASGYEFKMASQQSNPLSAILPLYTLVILTSGGDFISTVAGAMNASNVNFNQKSYNGSSRVPPIILGDSGLYVPLGQQTINAIAYSYEKDGFSHDNILFQAQALAKNKRITGLAYQRDPVNLIWAVLDDGTLLSCTYIPGQGFLAWTRHDTRGEVLSINTVTSPTGNDEIWMVTRRTLGDGTEKQYLEVLEDMRPYGGTPTAETAFYVDCGLTGVYDDDPVTVISGLEHLEGMEVVILADFGVEERQTVQNGSITLPRPASAVHVGLPYDFRLKTINFELLDQGTLRNTRRAMWRVFPEVEDTRELRCSLNGGEAYELIVHDAETFGTPQLMNGEINPFTLKARETDGAWAEFSSGDPLPCSVLNLVAEMTHGDS